MNRAMREGQDLGKGDVRTHQGESWVAKEGFQHNWRGSSAFGLRSAQAGSISFRSQSQKEPEKLISISSPSPPTPVTEGPCWKVPKHSDLSSSLALCLLPAVHCAT